jgi:hypothetical protein
MQRRDQARLIRARRLLRQVPPDAAGALATLEGAFDGA